MCATRNERDPLTLGSAAAGLPAASAIPALMVPSDGALIQPCTVTNCSAQVRRTFGEHPPNQHRAATEQMMSQPNRLPNGPEDSGEQPKTVRLSYQELAARLGVSYDTARIKAKRRWRIEYGNDGRPAVIVPLVELEAERMTERSVEPPANTDRSTPEHDPNSLELVRSLRSELAEAHGALADARERMVAAETKLEVVEAERERERQQLEATIADLRRRLDAEEELRRRPWWQRLFAGSAGT